ncbi:MAG: hypothetical protein R3F54_30535 [Alphaproteobacteria bacterium]
MPIDEHLLARTDDRFESEAFVGLMLGDIRRACEDVLTDDDFALLARTKQGKDSYQDIADDLGVPIGTLASRVGRIRNVIRKRLEEMGELT